MSRELLGLTDPKIYALHTCDNPPCVNPDHLYAGTPVDNTRDRETRGRSRFLSGELRRDAKLTNDQAREIIRLRRDGVLLTTLAERFAVSTTLICKIANGRGWRHLHSADRRLVSSNK